MIWAVLTYLIEYEVIRTVCVRSSLSVPMVVCPMFCCTHLYLPKRLWVEITARTALHQNPTDQKLMQYVCCYEFIIFFPPFSLSLGWLK